METAKFVYFVIFILSSFLPSVFVGFFYSPKIDIALIKRFASFSQVNEDECSMYDDDFQLLLDEFRSRMQDLSPEVCFLLAWLADLPT